MDECKPFVLLEIHPYDTLDMPETLADTPLIALRSTPSPTKGAYVELESGQV